MDDIGIIELFFARSENAITEASAKYGAYCMSIAQNILSSRSDAEECVNDACLAAWNTIPPTRPERLSVFLGKITRNIAMNRYDYNNAKKRSGEFSVLLSELGDIASAADDTAATYEAGRAADTINAFLRTLDAESRQLFVRRYWYSDSIEALSKRFGMSGSKVKSMLFRLRKRLKAQLEKEGIAV